MRDMPASVTTMASNISVKPLRSRAHGTATCCTSVSPRSPRDTLAHARQLGVDQRAVLEEMQMLPIALLPIMDRLIRRRAHNADRAAA